MSLIEKALEIKDVMPNSEDTKMYVSGSNPNGLDSKKSLRNKILMVVLLPVVLLIITGLVIYQKHTTSSLVQGPENGVLAAQPPAATHLNTIITNPVDHAETPTSAMIKSNKITEHPVVEEENRLVEGSSTPSLSREKESLASLSDSKGIPELVMIENNIESHDGTPVEMNEQHDRAKDNHLHRHYNHAVKLEKEGKWMDAVFAYERSIVEQPDHVKSYNNLGGVYQKIDRLDLAVEAYKKALAINPSYVKVHNNLGLALFRLDKINEAMDEFTIAISMDSENMESYNNLGLLYKHRGEIEKAKTTFKGALLIDPNHPEIHYNLGLLYESEDNLKQAFTHYQNFIEFGSPKYSQLKKSVHEHLFVLAKKSVLKDNIQNRMNKE